ncbi:MAG: tetratricopeptide repeat protein, partial [Candidatus Aegiribacteria sp.]|nr:tetratricopeptide repeat protein [Candidatus Aegiribacteria sp.]MBD3295406.1 tetratricopeptide repeat protein [Candidatus Fermentibacteria bacterium]
MDDQRRDEIAELERRVEEASTASLKVQAMSDLAWKVKYSDPGRAVKLSDEAIQTATEVGLTDTLPKAYLSRALGLTHLSKFEKAESSARLALEIYSRKSQPRGSISAHNILGSIYFRWGKLSAALKHYMEAQSIFRELNNSSDPGIMSNIGGVHLQLGNTETALECYMKVDEMASGMEGPADLKTAALVNMGEIYSRMKLYDAAHDKFLAAKSIAEKNDMKQSMGAVYDNIGSVMIDLKRYDEASEYFGKALAVFETLNDTKGEALVLSNMGRCSLAAGGSKAYDYYSESLSRFRSLNDSQGVAGSLIGLSRVMSRKGADGEALSMLSEAYDYYSESLFRFRSLDDSQGVAGALIGLARVMSRRGADGEALSMLSEALEVAGLKGLKPQLSEIHRELSSIFESKEEFEKALMHLKLHYEIENKLRSERADRRLQSLRVMNEFQTTETPEEPMPDKDSDRAEDRDEEFDGAFLLQDEDMEPEEDIR